MNADRIVLITMPYDQVDILEDFLDWHLHIGIDLILALDGGSTDGTRDVLDKYATTGRVVWFPLTERDMTKYSIADTLATMARQQYQADWIIYCDVDEFLSTHGEPLRAILAECKRDEITCLDIPRRTMTGLPIPPGRRATEALTLRIDRTVVPTAEKQITWDFGVPFVFLEVGGHLAVRASAVQNFGMGMHAGTTTWGRSGTSDLYILHFAIRGYDEFVQKVQNAERWIRDNPHLPPAWGWHWRRWIHLAKNGSLREEYDRQFVSSERWSELALDGTCTVDTTVASWLAERDRRPTPAHRPRLRWFQQLVRAVSPTGWGVSR